ncbi:hypothetical protein CP557_21435 [Natrinema ejinorense]|uniref:Uncharacterized protein n=1 Tax=Natrinema ejinorense TaxID=373386 RepID=A0A2A5QQ91_9EURY|nr:hypothetical protein CP557_21435 [Natrinema ejinorense]
MDRDAAGHQSAVGVDQRRSVGRCDVVEPGGYRLDSSVGTDDRGRFLTLRQYRDVDEEISARTMRLRAPKIGKSVT